MAIVDFNSHQGKQLIRNLYAYSFAIYEKLYKAEVNERGKSFRDYVSDALDNHLRGLDKYDPMKSPLEYHLKYHVIRRELYNDLPPHVKKKYALERQSVGTELESVQFTPQPKSPKEPTLPENSIINLSDHDRELLFTELEKEITGDDVVERIYLAVAHDKFNLSDREEICQECGISHKDFDNGRRRFMTILRRVFPKLKLTHD